MSEVVDVRGEPCPVPVVRTRKAMMKVPGVEGNTDLTLTVLVSKRDQVDNVIRMAGRSGWTNEYAKASDHYQILLKAPSGPVTAVKIEPEDLVCELPVQNMRGDVAVVASETMGRGSDELGGVLIRAFLGVLKDLDRRPGTIIFYNGGVKLVIDGSPVLAEIEELDELGIELLVCGTCLDYFGVKDRVRVGTISNMYDIATAMIDAGNAVVL